MRCSKCSEVVRPIVAVDIDGTMGDYHGHLIDFGEQYLGKALPCAWQYNGQGEFGAAWERDGVDRTTYRQVKLAYRQGGMKRTMPFYPLAGELLDALVEHDVEIWVTTTRPYLRLDGVDPDTREWLRRHEIGYDGLLYDEDKYHVLAERVDRARVVAVIDDLPEQYDAAAECFGPGVPILAASRWNRGTAAWRRQRGALDFVRGVVVNRVIAWKEHHAKVS